MILVSDMWNKRAPPPPLRRVLAAAAGAALVPLVAYAHAIVIAASPAAGAEVAAGDLDIRLEFNSRIDPDRSRLALRDPENRMQPVDPRPSDAPNVLAGHARVATPGRWTVHWQVLSRDGHITRGDIPVTVHRR
ncbi:MAG TPA: copper resistance CopC family protein [Casimicrobiaceae bacterium]|jgi:hypothetical protein